MHGREPGHARFVCPDCGHAVGASWRKRTQLYEGRCLHCERWHRYRRPNEPALPSME